ncbi:MAG: M20/M25/M40 family metallo-hydrolase [Syntrophobacteraceae bacterium]|nr:M20/M25/M40 family metallo-hydrolase [Desulfobacteraceae bacterium]
MSKAGSSIQPQRLRRLLRKMMDIYSPSGKEEEILAFLHSYLKRHGLPVFQQPVDGNRFNIVVAPPDTEIRLALIGHVDTVMAYDLDRFGYEEQQDRIEGLGAADMKGGCAAMIEAFLALWKNGGHRPPVALALVVGEEEEGDGSQKLVKDFHFPWALIGEPTDLKPCLNHYGYIELQITTTGRRMHASLANMGHNPIEAMLRLLLKISRYIETQHPETVYNIRDLASSHTGFAVPDRCDSWVDIHLPPTSPLGAISLELEEIFAAERAENADFNGTLRFATFHGGYELPEKGPIVENLKESFALRSLAWEPQAFRSHSDANLLWASGTKPILLGPGQLEKAHAPDESIPFSQVVLAAELYCDFIRKLSE